MTQSWYTIKNFWVESRESNEHHKKIIKGIVAVLILIGLVIGGIKIMQQVQYDEMVNIVKSEEVKNIIENNLKLKTCRCFRKWRCNSIYQIDMDSINIVQWEESLLKFILITWNSYTFIFLINKDLNSGKLVTRAEELLKNSSELIRNQK